MTEADRKDMKSTPVFIYGYPKSGTTLLLALLDRHPELLVYPEETKFFNIVSGKPVNRNPDFILTETPARLFAKGEVQVTSGYRDYRDVDADLFAEKLRERWNAGDRSERDLFEATILSYGDEAGQKDRRYWVEKTPMNELHLNKLHRWWSEVRAIYILRDPRDNFVSYEKLWKLRKSVLSPIRFMAYWTDSIRAWRYNRLPLDNKLLIRYRDLVSYPQEVMQTVADFLEIDWDDGLLLPTRNGGAWAGNSMHEQDFSGISTGSLGKYTSLFSEKDLVFLESWLGKTMTRYGWETQITRTANLSELIQYPEKIILKSKLIYNLLRMGDYPV